jgi:hypothetical protein
MSLLLLPTIAQSRSRFLPETIAFATASGATDLVPLNNLFDYVISESLWNNFRIYPQKSAQNANAGSTVFGAGALTSNNGTLIGSPTWGANGITFNTSTQAMRISDFLGSETLTIWCRRSGALVDAGIAISQFETTGDQRGFTIGEAAGVTDAIAIRRSANGQNLNAVPGAELYSAGANSYPVTDDCVVGQWIDGGGRALWVNNVSQSISRIFGQDQTVRFNSSADIIQNALLVSGSLSNFFGGQYTALAFLAGSTTPTTTQRETITNLLNAL